MIPSFSNHWFQLLVKAASNPRHWTDELRLSSPHGPFCLWNGHAVTQEQREVHLAPRPPQTTPSSPVRSRASDSRYQVPAGSAPNGLPQFPFCLLHFGLTQQTHTHGRALQPGRSQRLETKKAPFRFIYLFVCLQFSPSVHGQGFQWLAPGKGSGRNQFSITSEITGHWIIGAKSLWRANPVWKRADWVCAKHSWGQVGGTHRNMTPWLQCSRTILDSVPIHCVIATEMWLGPFSDTGQRLCLKKWLHERGSRNYFVNLKTLWKSGYRIQAIQWINFHQGIVIPCGKEHSR